VARETFRCLLVCGHVIIVNTDLPWEFHCPQCGKTQKVQINSRIRNDSPVHRIPRRRRGN
jgi:predicted RNA-binding Zn-ribbon protein involved in translation (DUF1610 family)